jgi:two-component SAPR family response regulator
MRILVIDDDRVMLGVLRRILAAKHEVFTAESAGEAFHMLAMISFDVILCDVHLQGIHGATFQSKLSSLDASRMIFMTGGAFEKEDDDFIATHRVLMKPFTQGQLAEAIDALAREAA